MKILILKDCWAPVYFVNIFSANCFTDILANYSICSEILMFCWLPSNLTAYCKKFLIYRIYASRHE